MICWLGLFSFVICILKNKNKGGSWEWKKKRNADNVQGHLLPNCWKKKPAHRFILSTSAIFVNRLEMKNSFEACNFKSPISNCSTDSI